MQRVVVLFVVFFSVVRATPFDPDNVDLSTFVRHNFRVEKGELGNDAIPEDSVHEDEIETFKSGENFNSIDESDDGKFKGINNLFGDLEVCDIITMSRPPKEGCIYVANGDVYFAGVLSEVDIEDVYIAFEEAGIGKCKVGEDEFDVVPDGGCFQIKEAKESVYWVGVYDDTAFYENVKFDDIKGLFGNVEKCNFSEPSVPKEGCSLFAEDGIHYLNALKYDEIDEVERSLSELNIPKCDFDKELGVITTKEPCYFIVPFLQTIHFLNVHLLPEVVQDDVNNDDHYSEETDEDPDVEVSPPSLVQPTTGSGNLYQLTLKGLFNTQPVDAKKTKLFSQKIYNQDNTFKQLKRYLDAKATNMEGNHRPKWMKYLQTTV